MCHSKSDCTCHTSIIRRTAICKMAVPINASAPSANTKLRSTQRRISSPRRRWSAYMLTERRSWKRIPAYCIKSGNNLKQEGSFCEVLQRLLRVSGIVLSRISTPRDPIIPWIQRDGKAFEIQHAHGPQHRNNPAPRCNGAPSYDSRVALPLTSVCHKLARLLTFEKAFSPLPRCLSANSPSQSYRRAGYRTPFCLPVRPTK